MIRTEPVRQVDLTAPSETADPLPEFYAPEVTS